jgi:membrane protein YqaA with SNARE-associated domain
MRRTLLAKLSNWLKQQIDSRYFSIIFAALTALDYWIVVVPVDLMFTSSVLLRPKKWMSIALGLSLGATLGGVTLVFCVNHLGLAFVQNYFPALLSSSIWQSTETLFNSYGLWAVFFVGLSPIAQQPSLILAGLTKLDIPSVAASLFAGRIIKYVVVGYLCSEASNKFSESKVSKI